MEEEKEFTIPREAIKTMKKDIARFKGEGEKPSPVPSLDASRLQRDTEGEEERRMEEEKESKRLEEERKKREEEENKKKEEEERRAEEEKIRYEAEEKKRREEQEKIRREKKKPKTEKEILLEEKKEIQRQRIQIEEMLQKLAVEKKPLEKQKEEVLRKIKEVEESFQKIAGQEKLIEEKQRKIEEKETAAERPDQRRILERERWKVEERRRELEKQRWPWDEKLKELNSQLYEIKTSSAEIEAREGKFIEQGEKLIEKQEKIQLKSEKIDLEEQLQNIEGARTSFEEKKAAFSGQLEDIDGKLEKIKTEEGGVEEEKRIIEEEERGAEDLEKRRELEKERWEIEEKRRKIESARWGLEGERQKIKNQAQEFETRFKTLSERRNNIIKRIKEIEAKIEGKIPAFSLLQRDTEDKEEKQEEEKKQVIFEIPKEKEMIKEDKGKKEIEQTIEQARKRIEDLKKPSFVPLRSGTTEGKEEKNKEEQKRKEIAQKMAAEVEKKREMAGHPPKIPSEVIRIVPQKPTLSEKLWVRILIVSIILVLLAGIFTFWYWYFRVREQLPIGSEGPKEILDEEEPSKPSESSEKKEVVLLQSLFPVGDTRDISVLKLETIPLLVAEILKEWQADDQFKQIIIKKENKVISLREFFQALLIRMPDNFYEKVESNFTLFSYAQPQGNRLGFIIEVIDKQGLINLLKSQETTIEDDFKVFFGLMGKNKPALIPYFRNANKVQGYEGPDFRYKTLTQEDLGICYFVSDDYLVFTSSWRSMEHLLGRLKVNLPTRQLTEELKYGDMGEQVKLLQTWLAKDPQVYPEGTISGKFWKLTQKAVVRFQQKYASEVLAPQGLEKGTGIVDSFTRNKLNELYGTLVP